MFSFSIAYAKEEQTVLRKRKEKGTIGAASETDLEPKAILSQFRFINIRSRPIPYRFHWGSFIDPSAPSPQEDEYHWLRY